MQHKGQAIRDEGITAIGGLLGGTLGAFAGPEGAAIGAALGSVGFLSAAKFAPDVIHNTLLHRFINNRKVVKLLTAKVEDDFKYSFLDTQGTFDAAMTTAREMLALAHRADPNVAPLESRLPRSFRWSLCERDVPADVRTQAIGRLAAHCRDNGPIRIACPSICSGPIGLFQHLDSALGDESDVHYKMTCHEINGRDFFAALKNSCDIDFAIGPIEALVLCDPERKLPLRIIGPMFGERQRIFVSTKKRIGFQSGIWVFSRSSAKLQFNVGVAVPRSAEERPLEDARLIPGLAENIPAGDMVIAWDPLSSVLSKAKNFAEVHHSHYTVHFFLLGHTRVFPARRFPLNDFLLILLSEWRKFKHNQNVLVDTLRRSHAYMEAFATGCGHKWTYEC